MDATSKTTNQQGAIAKSAGAAPAKRGRAPQTIRDYIKVYEKEVAKALPSVMTPERFTRIVTTAITNTPKLAECTPQSFVGAMLNCAQLGLEPNTPLGQAYLIPYGKQCQMQIGYKGLLDLAYRSGQVSTVYAETVYENDTFDYELGLEPKLKHHPAMSNRGEPVYYYAVIKLKGEGVVFQVMSRDDIEKHARKYSKSFNNGPWKTDFDAMAKKTVLKQALKYAPLKTEFARDVAQDDTIKHFDPHDENERMADKPSDFIDVEAYEQQPQEG